MGTAASVPSDRSRPLKVIGAGYSRTGTLSLALALEALLEGPVMHGGSQLLGREDAYVKLWSDIFAARHDRPRLLKLLREAAAGFAAITDAPGNCFIEELLEIYPEARVVCVRRDRAKWWKSWEAVANRASSSFLHLLLAPVPGKRWYPKLVEQFGEQQQEKWGPMTENRMDEHNEYARSVTPPSQFHMMDLKDGWAPLCKIVGVGVPDQSFPRANDAEAVDAVAGQIFAEAGKIWLAIFASIGTLGYVASRLLL